MEMFQFTQYYNQKMEQQNAPEFLTTNSQNKIKLAKNNISLQFYFASNTQNGYKMSFMVRIVAPQTVQGQIRDSQIDQVSLRQAILDNVDEYDKKYMYLKTFSTNSAVFYFNVDKWIKDAFNNFDTQKEFSIFNRKIKLKAVPPKMIMYDPLRSGFITFITAKMKDYIVNKNIEKQKFIPFLPTSFVKSLDKKAGNLFNYEYDMQYNTLYVRLKPEVVISASLILATGIKAYKDLKNKDLKDPKYFNDSVKKTLDKTNKQWDMLINKRLM